MSQNCELDQREEESNGNHEETYVPVHWLTVPTQVQIECRRVDSRSMLELRRRHALCRRKTQNAEGPLSREGRLICTLKTWSVDLSGEPRIHTECFSRMLGRGGRGGRGGRSGRDFES